MRERTLKKKYSFPIDAVLLVGPTGVGKSPLGDFIAQNGLFRRKSHHLDFGSELRGAVSDGNRSAVYSREELDFIHGVLDKGLLLENEHFPLAEKIVSLFLDRCGFSGIDLVVLNGIPRHAGQANDMERMAHVAAVIVLDCSGAVVVKRIESNIGGDRTERVDDKQDLIEKKLRIFRERTAPLVAHYEMSKSSIYRITVTDTMTPADAYRQLSGLAALHPPISLVAEPPQR
jgi:adenylate kinase family enzyme